MQCTLVSGKAASVTASVSRRGTMGPSIAVSGERIVLMAKAVLFMSTAMSTMDIGPTTKPTAEASTST